MRRILLLFAALFLLSTCSYRPAQVDDARPGSTAGAQPCREVRRARCDTGNCGANQDLVTLQCAGGTVTRCEMNTGCTVR